LNGEKKVSHLDTPLSPGFPTLFHNYIGLYLLEATTYWTTDWRFDWSEKNDPVPIIWDQASCRRWKISIL